MSRRLAFSALGAFVVLMSMMPVHAGPAPMVLRCNASGNATHFDDGGFNENEVWEDINATGRCLGVSGDPLNVTVNGHGVGLFFGDRLFELDVRLSDSTGKSRVLQQTWRGHYFVGATCKPIEPKFLILRRAVPVGGNWSIGAGGMGLCHTHPTENTSIPILVSISMKWYLVTPQFP